GARGGNGGMHDVDNLCWKLARVVTGSAAPDLLESYNHERVHGADENIRNSSWTSRFMSPEPGVEMAFRNAALSLAVDTPFARRIVNAGRLSVPCHLESSPLNGQDSDEFDVPQRVGMVALDAPLSDRDGNATWLMSQLGGRFVCLVTGEATAPSNLPEGVDVVRVGRGGFGDADGLVQQRYGNGVYLVRPDQHVTARWMAPGPDDLRAALARCEASVTA
ncbi:MAG: FAD-dependent monooxygenase, partial [Candidatus Puniceispirillaceae bacterium]